MLQTVTFSIKTQGPVFFKSEPGNRIISVSPPGPASQYPARCHQQTGKGSVHPQSIKGILWTRWHMAARRPQQRRYGTPVKMNRKGKQFYCNIVQDRCHEAKIDKRHKARDETSLQEFFRSYCNSRQPWWKELPENNFKTWWRLISQIVYIALGQIKIVNG